MSNDFPFDHFLKSNNNNDFNNLVNAKQSLKEFKLEKNSENTNSEVKIEEAGTSSQFSSEELSLINTEILKNIKEAISEQKFSAFFENTFKLENILSDSVQFNVTTPLIKTMVENHYMGRISESVKNILSSDYLIKIVVKENTSNPPLFNESSKISIDNNRSHSEAPKNASEAKFTLELNPTQDDLISKVESQYIEHMDDNSHQTLIDSKKTFDNFVIGPSNNLAFAASVSISKSPGKSGKYPSLYIHSNSGLGKTHLLHAVANTIKENYPQYVICLITARDFMKEMIEAIRNQQLHKFQKKYSQQVDVLMIDDIHELNKKTGTQNEFFHVFNELYNKGKQLIFTSDKAPQEIEGIEERIKTRLQWGLVVDIQRPDVETRIAILKRKASELDLYLPDDILSLIATSIKTSIRELEGSLIKLSAFADVMKVEIDVDMVKDILMLRSDETESKITLDSIIKATSQYFKIPVADIKSKARMKDIVHARFIAMYLSRKLINATQEEIGSFYGGRDHSSVVHAEKTITKKLPTDINLSRDIISIENNL